MEPKFAIDANPMYPTAGYEIPQTGRLFPLIRNKYVEESCNIFRKSCGLYYLTTSYMMKIPDDFDDYDVSLLFAYHQCRWATSSGNLEDVAKYCPSICRQKPCASIENALPYSCTHIKNDSLTVLNKYVDDVLLSDKCFKEYGTLMKRLPFGDFKCQCMLGFKWDHGNHKCVKDAEFSRCDAIKGLCNTGTCKRPEADGDSECN